MLLLGCQVLLQTHDGGRASCARNFSLLNAYQNRHAAQYLWLLLVGVGAWWVWAIGYGSRGP